MSTKNDKNNDDLQKLSEQLIIDFNGIENLKTYWFSHSRRQIDKEFSDRYNCSYYYAKKIFNNIFGFRDRIPEEFVVIQHKNMDKTNLKRYGRTNVGYFGTDEHNKAIKEKYGVEYISQSNVVKEKIKTTCNENYGVNCVLQVPAVREKIKKSIFEKYGCDNPMQVASIKAKSVETCLRRYGISNAGGAQETLDKIKNTNLRKYGVENFAQSEKYRREAHKKYLFKDLYFDSSWELALYVYAEDHGEEIEREPIRIKYLVDNKVHYYFPDFRYKGKLIEIKGTHLIDGQLKLKQCYKSASIKQLKAKTVCMKENNIEIWTYDNIKFALDYIKETYGKNYLKQFKDKEINKDGENNDRR